MRDAGCADGSGQRPGRGVTDRLIDQDRLESRLVG